MMAIVVRGVQNLYQARCYLGQRAIGLSPARQGAAPRTAEFHREFKEPLAGRLEAGPQKVI